MVDTDVVGCNWIEVPAKAYKIRSSSSNPPASSSAQIEVDVAWDRFISHPADGQWQKVAPFRILSYDIECAGRKGTSPFISNPKMTGGGIMFRNLCKNHQGEGCHNGPPAPPSLLGFMAVVSVAK